MLNLTLGENGILKLAEKAGKNYQDASVYEQSELEKLYKEMLNGNLPENTPTTEAGTKVRLPNGWKTGTPNYIETTKGEIVKESVEIATVEAIAVGNGKTVPVPIGFYYVGGNLESGVVISDSIADQNKYAGQADVPSGIEGVTNKEGKVEINRTLQGNQFVWIPCDISNYKKCNVWNGTTQTNTVLANTWWDSSTAEASEKIQIRKYGGFYVGRYEAGIATTIKEYNEDQSEKSDIYNKEGIPQSKAGAIPWNFIDWTQSKSNAEKMYNTSTVNSGLITGTQWDVMINKIGSIKDEKGNTKYLLIDSGSWGNYYDKVTTGYTGRYATYDTSSKALSTFNGKIQTNGTKNADLKILLTTGASDKTRAYNIYDVAGNLWEWTEETSFSSGNSDTLYKVARGGVYMGDSTNFPVCYRRNNYGVSQCFDRIGFRVVLYMK